MRGVGPDGRAPRLGKEAVPDLKPPRPGQHTLQAISVTMFMYPQKEYSLD